MVEKRTAAVRVHRRAGAAIVAEIAATRQPKSASQGGERARVVNLSDDSEPSFTNHQSQITK
jgi:hypothetical protein